MDASTRADSTRAIRSPDVSATSTERPRLLLRGVEVVPLVVGEGEDGVAVHGLGATVEAAALGRIDGGTCELGCAPEPALSELDEGEASEARDLGERHVRRPRQVQSLVEIALGGRAPEPDLADPQETQCERPDAIRRAPGPEAGLGQLQQPLRELRRLRAFAFEPVAEQAGEREHRLGAQVARRDLCAGHRIEQLRRPGGRRRS